MNNQFTHINQDGKANMVDVTDKKVTERQAVAQAYVQMSKTTLDLIISGVHHKGYVTQQLTLRYIAVEIYRQNNTARSIWKKRNNYSPAWNYVEYQTIWFR